MKILHISLYAHYTEGMLYQENVLIDMNIKDGNDVTIITDIMRYENGKLVPGPEEDRTMANGARLIRLKHDRVIGDFLTEKIQKCRRLRQYLQEIEPDTILYHGVNGYEMMDVADYVKIHPDCLFFMDSHEDYTNSAMTPASKAFYKTIHGHFVKKALPQVDKVLYLGSQMRDWLKDIYHIPDEKMEFFALGGIIYDENQQAQARQEIIDKFALPKDAIIMAHSGKLSAEKRSAELLEAFSQVKDPRMALFVFGSIPDEQKDVIRPLIDADSRIHFMGWKVNKEIEEFLAGVDIYCQPGSQSSTFETAICCGCVNMTWPHETYKDETYTDCNGENYFYVDGVDDIVAVFREITSNPQIINEKKEKSFAFAQKQFDYEKIAQRIYRK